MSEPILFECTDGVAKITLNAPERHNALGEAAAAQLIARFESIATDDTVRAVIITGAGDSFCSGGDLREFATGDDLSRRYFETRGIAHLFRAVSESGRPVIAAVRGHCIGIGLGIALSSDLVVAADDAVFAAPEVEIGLFPFMIAPIIRRTLPRIAANGLMLLNERVSGERLLTYGMANRVVPGDEVMPLAEQWAAELATAPAGMMRVGLDAHRHADGMAFVDELNFMHSHLPVATVNDETRDRLKEKLGGGRKDNDNSMQGNNK